MGQQQPMDVLGAERRVARVELFEDTGDEREILREVDGPAQVRSIDPVRQGTRGGSRVPPVA